MVAVGLYAARRVRKTADYFLGNRSFSVWLVIGQALGVGTHAEMPVSLAGKVYQSGYAGIWYQWKNLFITPFYWILAPLFRRFRRTTTGEVYEDRYGSWMGAVYTLFALAYFTFNMGAMLKGAGKLVSVASGEAVSANAVVLAMTATFLLYSFVGGLVSAAYTDFVQSIFIVALSFLLIPIGLRETGGFTGIRDTLEPGMLSMVTPGDVGVFTIVMLTLNGLIGIVAQPAHPGKRGHRQGRAIPARIGMAYGNFIKRFCTIGWALVGIIVATLLVQRGEAAFADPEDAFGYATRELLFPGGLGLMIACVLAANMSTGSAFMVDSAALFTQNLYRRYVARDRSDRHYLWSGRFAGVAMTLLGGRLRPLRRQCSAGHSYSPRRSPPSWGSACSAQSRGEGRTGGGRSPACSRPRACSSGSPTGSTACCCSGRPTTSESPLLVGFLALAAGKPADAGGASGTDPAVLREAGPGLALERGGRQGDG